MAGALHRPLVSSRTAREEIPSAAAPSASMTVLATCRTTAGSASSSPPAPVATSTPSTTSANERAPTDNCPVRGSVRSSSIAPRTESARRVATRCAAARRLSRSSISPSRASTMKNHSVEPAPKRSSRASRAVKIGPAGSWEALI
jgi:hypothetical protein